MNSVDTFWTKTRKDMTVMNELTCNTTVIRKWERKLFECY